MREEMCNCLQVVKSAVDVEPCGAGENSLRQVDLTVIHFKRPQAI